MRKPRKHELLAVAALPAGLGIAALWMVLWALRCRHRQTEEVIHPEGFALTICRKCGEEVEEV